MNWLKLLGLPTLVFGSATVLPQLAQGQITTGGDGTLVTPPGGSTIDITGGTQAGNNLFHSFSQFNVDTGQTANFIDPGVQNILGRVTGGNASLINGVLQVTGGNANLYLMNPAGIIFGSGASLDVLGSFSATTANGIGFGSRWFNAIGLNDYTNLVGTPDSFAFTMQQPGAIVNAARLAVREEQRLILAGGTVISTGTLNAPQGHIVLTTATGSSLVQITEVGRLLRLEVQPLISTANQPQPWTQDIASLPALLTGNGLGNATDLNLNPDGSVSLVGSGLRVEQGDIVVTQPISGSRELVNGISTSTAPMGITMISNNKITTGGIRVTPGRNSDERQTIDLSANSDIQTGRIDFAGADSPRIPEDATSVISDNNPPDNNGVFKGVKLFSQAGNVTIETISTFDGDVDITAAGLFRATGFFGDAPPSGVFDSETFNASDGYAKRLRDYLPRDPASNQFFIDKTGLTQAELDNALDAYYFAEARVYAPVSIRAFGIISIRYGNGSSLVYGSRSDSNSLTVTGSAPFVIGPDSSSRLGDIYIPVDPDDRFENFRSQPFDVVQNESYTLSTIPDEVSGTRGAIVQGILSNGTFYTPLQDIVFGILPPPPCPSCNSQPTSPNSNPATVPAVNTSNPVIDINPSSSPAVAPTVSTNSPTIDTSPDSSPATAPVANTSNPEIDPLVELRQQFQAGEAKQAMQQQLNKQNSICVSPVTATSTVETMGSLSDQTPSSTTFTKSCTTNNLSADDTQILKILGEGVK
jgi:filamentous hemagglutinin family protein